MKQILAASDLSEAGCRAIGRASKLARETGARLEVVHVLDPAARFDDCSGGRRGLRQQVTKLGASARVRLVMGIPGEAIAEEAERCDAELIVLGGHGTPRLRDAIFGTTASHVLRESGCPVLIAIKEPDRPYRRLLAAVDDECAEDVVRLACSVRSARELFVVHVILSLSAAFSRDGAGREQQRKAQQDVLDRLIDSLPRRANSGDRLSVHALVEEGDVISNLMRAWKDIQPDLLVLGTHGRSWLDRLVRGSVAQTAVLGCLGDMLVFRTRPPERGRDVATIDPATATRTRPSRPLRLPTIA